MQPLFLFSFLIVPVKNVSPGVDSRIISDGTADSVVRHYRPLRIIEQCCLNVALKAREIKPMTPTTLQALRRLLFFSREEAAQWIAVPAVSEQQWRDWESGSLPLPETIAQRMQELAEWRSTALAATADNIRRQIREKGGVPEAIIILWYERREDWTSLPHREPVMWRVQQSVCAALLGMFHTIQPVPFDATAYSLWLDGRDDSESLRAEWASTR